MVKCGIMVVLYMNVGLMVDLFSFESLGVEGVGLFCIELQFLVCICVLCWGEFVLLYLWVLENVYGKLVMFWMLDIGLDKVLFYMKLQDELNFVMGWCVICVGLDKCGVLCMQLQVLICVLVGQLFYVMFFFVIEMQEFEEVYCLLMEQIVCEQWLGYVMFLDVWVGVMLEMLLLVFVLKKFFEMCDFILVGGNDLKQFFFVVDCENECVWWCYDMLVILFINLLEQIL